MKVVLLGVNHGLQRCNQNGSEICTRQRALFVARLEGLLHKEEVTLIAEEACNDERVAEHLSHLFGHPVTPEETLAKLSARKISSCRHIDICPAQVRQSEDNEVFENQMIEALIRELREEDKALIICGELHRVGIVEKLRARGVKAEPGFSAEEAWTGPYGIE
jgi:hypothetical protein